MSLDLLHCSMNILLVTFLVLGLTYTKDALKSKHQNVPKNKRIQNIYIYIYLIIYIHISNGETGLMGEIESNNLRIALKRRENTTLYVGN